MDKIINISGQNSGINDRIIMELDILRDEMIARIDRLKAMFSASASDHNGAARYQRTRMICSSKRRTRDYLEGKQ